jgi:hypothetical protein
VISGMLNLSRNLGLTTGACVMGAVFAYAVALSSAKVDITTAHPRPLRPACEPLSPSRRFLS